MPVLRSPLYWTPRTYRLGLRLLYRSAFEQRFRIVAEQIPAGASVVDLCCGCAYLYEGFLSAKVASYTGVDIIPSMVEHVRGLGQRGERLDLTRDGVPSGDVVVMMGSLYHFAPREDEILARMVAAAHKRVILLEPVVSGAPGVLARLARWGTFVGRTASRRRLDSERLDRLLAPHEVLLRRSALGGKYVLAVLRGR